jgi:hypothetical protein
MQELPAGKEIVVNDIENFGLRSTVQSHKSNCIRAVVNVCERYYV